MTYCSHTHERYDKAHANDLGLSCTKGTKRYGQRRVLQEKLGVMGYVDWGPPVDKAGSVRVWVRKSTDCSCNVTQSCVALNGRVSSSKLSPSFGNLKDPADT